MMARVAAQGFFLLRVADSEAESTELIDIPTQA
jgi:hypothetical protein